MRDRYRARDDTIRDLPSATFRLKAFLLRHESPRRWAGTKVAELGDLTRFATPQALMNCLGLLPSASSAGAPRRQGSLTKAAHAHARRALVEGAWASRDPAKVRRHLHLSLETPPKVRQDIRWKARGPLGKRYRRLDSRGTHPNGVTVTIARELAGFMWASAKEGPVPPESQDA